MPNTSTPVLAAQHLQRQVMSQNQVMENKPLVECPVTYLVAASPEVLSELIKQNQNRVNPDTYNTLASRFNTMTVDFAENAKVLSKKKKLKHHMFSLMKQNSNSSAPSTLVRNSPVLNRKNVRRVRKCRCHFSASQVKG